jgi:hypothetical protein
MSEIEHDELIPDPQARKEFGRSQMTFWRWDRDPEMIAAGWPLPIVIRNRNYRSRRKLEQFKNGFLTPQKARTGARDVATTPAEQDRLVPRPESTSPSGA